MRDTLGVGSQHGLLPTQRTNNATIKLGKVVSVHPEDGSVDVMLLDAAAIVTMPVLSHFMGSNFGVTCLPGPSYDPQQPAKKTYPQSREDAQHSPTNSSHVGRDTYAVVLQMEGSFLGTADSCVIGFLPPQVSEMLFARHEMNDDGTPTGEEGEFDDLMLMRHPSDLQITLDKKSKLSVQLPNGTRFTMGPDVGAVNLTRKDYDKRYEIRENLSQSADAYIAAVDASGLKRADVLISAGGIIHAVVYGPDGKQADLFMSSEGIWEGAVYSGGEQQTARVRMVQEGNLEGFAMKEVHAHNAIGVRVKLKQDGSAEVVAPVNIKMQAGANIEIEAGGQVLITGATIKGLAGRIDWN